MCHLCHRAWHEAANACAERAGYGPYHRAAHSIRLRDEGVFGYVVPEAVFKSDAVVAVFRFPVGVSDSVAVGVGAARTFAALKRVKPGLEWGLGVASIVATDAPHP